MTCPVCNAKTKVIDTVTTNTTVLRRRKCITCDHLFYTEEVTHDEIKHTFNAIKTDRYDRKPISSEELKLRLIKKLMEEK